MVFPELPSRSRHGAIETQQALLRLDLVAISASGIALGPGREYLCVFPFGITGGDRQGHAVESDVEHVGLIGLEQDAAQGETGLHVSCRRCIADDSPPVPAVKNSPANPPAATSPPQPEPTAARSDKEMAWRIEHGGAAAYAKSVVSAGLGEVGDINVLHHYVDSIAKRCAVDDPLQQMLCELSVLAYHRVAALQVASSQGRTPEATVAFNSAAVKLQAELRKSMLTLRELQQMPLEAGVFVQRLVRE